MEYVINPTYNCSKPEVEFLSSIIAFLSECYQLFCGVAKKYSELVA